MGQGDSARDFDPSESMENAGILDVFPIFHTAQLGQKIHRSPLLPPKRCCLKYARLVSEPGVKLVDKRNSASFEAELLSA